MTLSEQVARAIAKLVPLDDGSLWTPEFAPKATWPRDYSEAEKIRVRAIANAAIAVIYRSLREITPDVQEAGSDVIRQWDKEFESSIHPTREAWLAMLTAWAASNGVKEE